MSERNAPFSSGSTRDRRPLHKSKPASRCRGPRGEKRGPIIELEGMDGGWGSHVPVPKLLLNIHTFHLPGDIYGTGNR